jgi:hypothetical protein
MYIYKSVDLEINSTFSNECNFSEKYLLEKYEFCKTSV